MLMRDFGRTGLQVSAFGLGASHVGDANVSEDQAGRFLNEALDLGICLVDTAPGYGLSEERIGRHLAHRRQEFVLSTKCGYGVDGVEDWTPECIRRGVDRALRLMRTDVIDIMHFHSCEQWRLESTGIVEALLETVAQGKVRVAAYSGENEPRRWALESGAFRSIQTSINVCDQRVLEADLPLAAERGFGVIAKRPIANAFWRFAERPHGDYAEDYWSRARTMNLNPAGLPWAEFALRFTAFTPGVSSCIVGTSKLQNLRENLKLLDAGPLPPDAYTATRSAFQRHGGDWPGLV